MQAGLGDARGDLHGAGEAGGRRRGTRQLMAGNAGLAAHPLGHRVARQGSGFQNEHAARSAFRVSESGEELRFDARRRAQRSGSHREVSRRVDRPPGVLRCHAADGRMIGPDLDAGPRLAADRDRGGGDMTEAAHAQLGQRETRGESSGGGDPCIEDARAARERVNGDTQFGGPGGHLIGQPPCPFVHSKIWHGRELYVSWNGDISNEP